ncbi:hypothetical protein AABM38_06775 [Heyndrickxia sp. MSNUG]|uniref:hypothetical protein n=1 Tax=Heyndrickxia sp. MSNUG TaxID=3136677 RepID=UPI003C2C9B29
MERAAILGVYDFIGYSLCKYMLNDGVEIAGVHIASKHDKYFTEEKRMEIGRNANFSEISFKEWQATRTNEHMIISLYEQFNQDWMIEQYLNGIITKLENMDYSNQTLILILPAHLALKHEKLTDSQLELLRFIEKVNISILEIYLPTIYGPWQPEEYFFQQSLNYLEGESSIPVIAKWEWIHDALYIEDAVETIMELAESGKDGKYFFASGKTNLWRSCANELLGKQTELLLRKADRTPEINELIKVKILKNNEKISMGLKKQKEQYFRIMESKG